MTDRTDHVAAARRALEKERQGLAALIEALDDNGLGRALADVADAILVSKGRVILSGMGKSGHVARKIAATMASTATPAYYVHPAEASHGDLGMITTEDIIIMISNSGETPELKDMIEYSRRFGIPLAAITSRRESTLARAADHLLLLPQVPEACPLGIAPTTSTTMQLALGDALAMALLAARGFTRERFQDFHPGGKLGAILRRVRDVMHPRGELPLVHPRTSMRETLLTMTGRRFGCAGIVDDDDRLIGIITDGDLRRAMEDHPDLLKLEAEQVMTPSPKTLPPGELAAAALHYMNLNKITVVFVVDEDGRPVGIVHIHDLLKLEADEGPAASSGTGSP